MHDLRHSAVTILMAQGVPMALISRYIRHANIKTTADQYGHLCADDLGAVTDALDRVFSPVGTVVGTVKVQ
jgi:integrase